MDEERQKKMRLMKTGVVLVMALILVSWFFNFRNIWNRSNEPVAKNQEDWQEIRNGFSQSINDLENRLNQIGAAQKKEADAANRAFMADLIKNTAALASSTASSTLDVSSTPEIATSSPTSSAAIGKNNPKNRK